MALVWKNKDDLPGSTMPLYSRKCECVCVFIYYIHVYFNDLQNAGGTYD